MRFSIATILIAVCMAASFLGGVVTNQRWSKKDARKMMGDYEILVGGFAPCHEKDAEYVLNLNVEEHRVTGYFRKYKGPDTRIKADTPFHQDLVSNKTSQISSRIRSLSINGIVLHLDYRFSAEGQRHAFNCDLLIPRGSSGEVAVQALVSETGKVEWEFIPYEPAKH